VPDVHAPLRTVVDSGAVRRPPDTALYDPEEVKDYVLSSRSLSGRVRVEIAA